MNDNFRLMCSACGVLYSKGTYGCKKKDGILEAVYRTEKVDSIDRVKKDNTPGIWKYEKMLPGVDNKVTCYEGNTPLIPSRFYAHEMGIDLYFKDETRNPTGSFKDRAATVMLSMEKSSGKKAIVTASSGNAAGAIALYSMLAKIRCFIFMFKPTREKLVHAMSFGPTIFNVASEHEGEVLDLTKQAAEEFGWSILTTTADANPFTIEGYKTLAYEVYEQMQLPDSIVVPVGSGTLLVGIWKGFRELKKLGLINNVPRFIGVQARGNNPIVQAYWQGIEEVKPIKSSGTIAGGLSLENPGLTGKETLKAIRQTKGTMVDVSDDEIMKAVYQLPRKEGIYAEPSGAVGVAALTQLLHDGIFSKREKVVCVITGSGFKDVTSTNQSANKLIEIKPQLAEVKKHLK